MQTRKLYYEDAHLSEFTAQVMTCEKTDNGFEVTLDATAFYPEGGGQAGDTGYLGDIRVLDAQERGETIVHLCSGRLEIGATVKGRIDWDARFLRMQQHSGEHIVSGLIHGKYGYHNVGFHMGSELVTIDFDGPLTWEQLLEIEQEANEIIWENRPVKCWYPDPQTLSGIQYRSKKALDWPVRIVEFPGADICACCGTQVQQTGEIGLVKFVSCIRFKEGVRIEMASGRRAMQLFGGIFEQNRQVSQTFSAKILETGEAAKKFSIQLAQEKYRAAGLQKRVFAAIAASYAGRERVVHFEDDLTPGGVRELADAIAEQVKTAVVLSGSDEAGYSICILSKTGDTRELGRAVNAQLHGRGGGKPGAFQGSVQASRREIEEFFNGITG